jgi:sigma-B regulation protein RsbU (phosphoserine phosphatase)
VSSPWTIGVLAGSVLDEYQNTVLFGASDELREQGASVVLFAGGVLDSPDRTSAQRNSLYELIDRTRVDALIVLVSLGNDIGVAALGDYCARFAPLPVCTLSGTLPGTPSVLVDNARGMRWLVEHFVMTHACRRIAFIRGPVGSDEAERRFRIYRDVLEEQGIAFDPDLITVGDFNPPSGTEAVRVLCDERRVQFDALIAANDYMALAAIAALQERGFDVPGQIGVAGFDDIDEARFATPPLTTVRQPLHESGRQAGRIVSAMLRGHGHPARVVLDTLLVLRESCGCSLDRAVVTEASEEFSTVAYLPSFLESRKEDITRAVARAVSPEQARIPSDWAELLVGAFIADLRDATNVRFVAALAATLRRVVAAGGAIRAWHAVISTLGNEAMMTLGDPKSKVRADEVLHRARVLVGDIRERVQAQHRIQRERWIRTLHETSEALMTAFGETALVQAVAEQLPRLEIPACAIFVYAGTAETGITARARPLFLYDNGESVSLPSGDTSFPSVELAPRGWLSQRPRTIIAEPLAFAGEPLGFALFEVGPREGLVYEGLRELVSSAMKGARLVEQVVLEATARQRAERERIEKEMEIAARIQTAIVPKTIAVAGLDIAAAMIPATEVGGDYYDVVSFDGGCWIGVGDVAGHGLATGLVMLMIQSVVAGLVRREPRASPSDVFNVLNAVMYDNVHRRMGQDEYATLTLIRYDGGGHFVFAGAHEDIVVYRAKTRRCECIETRGPWVGAVANVARMIVESQVTLEPFDLMVLYTDGVTEAMDARGVQFGLERVTAIVETVAGEPVGLIRDHLMDAVRSWTVKQEDDLSVVVIRVLEAPESPDAGPGH